MINVQISPLPHSLSPGSISDPGLRNELFKFFENIRSISRQLSVCQKAVQQIQKTPVVSKSVESGDIGDIKELVDDAKTAANAANGSKDEAKNYAVIASGYADAAEEHKNTSLIVKDNCVYYYELTQELYSRINDIVNRLNNQFIYPITFAFASGAGKNINVDSGKLYFWWWFKNIDVSGVLTEPLYFIMYISGGTGTVKFYVGKKDGEEDQLPIQKTESGLIVEKKSYYGDDGGQYFRIEIENSSDDMMENMGITLTLIMLPDSRLHTQ